MDILALLQGGVYLTIVLVVALYLSYMIGLIRVLKRLGKLNWMAFVPILNYYASVRAMGAPARWFFFALIPYVGAIYAGSVAVRMGMIFNRNIPFSLMWLTIGSPVGMHIIARTPKSEIDYVLLEKRLGIIDIRKLRHELRLRKKAKQKAEALAKANKT